MMEFKTTVFDKDNKTKFLFGQAPELFRKSILGWLLKERGLFVGDSKKDGTFTRSLLSKKNSAGGTWSKSAAKAFRGKIDNTTRIQGMSLTMGIGVNIKVTGAMTPGRLLSMGRRAGFLESMAKMEEGYTQSSSKFMIIPSYKNLRDSFIAKKPYKYFMELMRTNKLDMISKGGKLFFFAKGENGKLLFIGVKKIVVPKKIKFTEAWQTRLPKVLDRGQLTIDRAVTRMNNGEY